MDKRKVPRHEDLTGKTFGRWLVLSKVPKNHKKYHKHALYMCLCSCGTKRIVSAIGMRSGHSQSCGCIRIEAVSKLPFESVYNRLVSRNPELSVGFLYLDYISFTTQTTCHYCAVPLVWCLHKERNKPEGHNLDRKDNSKGYSLKNCVVCCGSCNRTKGDRFSYEEFMLLAPSLRKIQRLRTHENRN